MRLLWFCASGDSFFLGIGLLVAAIVFSLKAERLWQKLTIRLTSIFGVVFILMLGASFNSVFSISWVVLTLTCFVVFAFKRLTKKSVFKVIACAAICLTATALLLELPFHLQPSMPKEKFETLYIVGDSVSAGINGKDEMTWPKVFREKYKVNVVDLSVAGATAGSALKQAIQVNSSNCVVLLEIGGNDLFGETPSEQFKDDLSKMLKQVTDGKRIVVMLELPLFPWQSRYGKIQRELAKKFDVVLVPKRFFIGVLSVEGVSDDIAHLTAKGHELMAEKMWQVLKDNLMRPLNNSDFL